MISSANLSKIDGISWNEVDSRAAFVHSNTRRQNEVNSCTHRAISYADIVMSLISNIDSMKMREKEIATEKKNA